MKNNLMEEIQSLLKKRENMPEESVETRPDYFDYKKTKAHSDYVLLVNRKKDIAKRLADSAAALMDKNSLPDGFLESVSLFRNTDLMDPKLIPAAEKIVRFLSDLELPYEEHKEIKVNFPKNTPAEIKGEIQEDLKEMESCFSAGCYRAATILCGRVLETALHRKYYETTGIDMLEKSPGIGLGNLISKLKAKNISFDPGITQQIHLINQIRIFSVHKKQERFYPTKPQTQAMILYTCDILSKLF